RQIKLNHKDTVIFSSSPIPGNQDSVNKVLDLLYKMEKLKEIWFLYLVYWNKVIQFLFLLMKHS
ncbi:MAG: hypothetical protein Q8835_03635, partial [Sweet potato little leaf phytoplasma]|nr:hypothetical protein [Sweet potato little leaf phytoplasma]